MTWKGLQWDSWKDVHVLYLNGSWAPRLGPVDPRVEGEGKLGQTWTGDKKVGT